MALVTNYACHLSKTPSLGALIKRKDGGNAKKDKQKTQGKLNNSTYMQV